MRSVKYHGAYWAIACTAATIYHALSLMLGVPDAAFYALLVPLLVFFIRLIVRGPCSEPWPCLYYVAVGALLVSLGSFSKYFSITGVEMTGPNSVVHSCVAFEVLGSLESTRQNRQDIEPCSVGIIFQAPGPNLARQTGRSILRCILEQFAVALSYLATLLFVTTILDFVLRRSYGLNISCLSITSYNISNGHEHIGSLALLFYIGAALADIAETLFLLILQYCSPSWPRVVQGATPLSDPIWGWTLCSSNIAHTSFLMVAHLLLMFVRHDEKRLTA